MLFTGYRYCCLKVLSTRLADGWMDGRTGGRVALRAACRGRAALLIQTTCRSDVHSLDPPPTPNHRKLVFKVRSLVYQVRLPLVFQVRSTDFKVRSWGFQLRRLVFQVRSPVAKVRSLGATSENEPQSGPPRQENTSTTFVFPEKLIRLRTLNIWSRRFGRVASQGSSREEGRGKGNSFSPSMGSEYSDSRVYEFRKHLE